MSIFNRIKTWINDDVTGNSLNNEFGNIINTLNLLDSGTVTWTVVNAASGTITTITATTATLGTAGITTATIGTANITTGNITTGNITTAVIPTATITTANITTGNITTANITTANITTAPITSASIGTLTSSLTFDNASTHGIVGTTTNNNAATGNVGEYLEGAAATTNLPASGAWGNDVSVTLTAGDWEVSVLVDFIADAGITWTRAIAGIGTVTGNDSTGVSFGVNVADAPLPLASVRNAAAAVPPWRTSLSGSQQYFLKVQGTYSGGTGRYRGRISARRMR